MYCIWMPVFQLVSMAIRWLFFRQHLICSVFATNVLRLHIAYLTCKKFRKRLKRVRFDHAYHWLLLALLDVSYIGTLQIPCWLIDWKGCSIASMATLTNLRLSVRFVAVLIRDDSHIWYTHTCHHTYAVVTCEIKLFQNYFTGLLQLMSIFQHVHCRRHNFEIILELLQQLK